jgi:hypothetical protein
LLTFAAYDWLKGSIAISMMLVPGS